MDKNHWITINSQFVSKKIIHNQKNKNTQKDVMQMNRPRVTLILSKSPDQIFGWMFRICRFDLNHINLLKIWNRCRRKRRNEDFCVSTVTKISRQGHKTNYCLSKCCVCHQHEKNKTNSSLKVWRIEKSCLSNIDSCISVDHWSN